jgi:uncharacterized BrkB/YihY/UPF0761 family membrane protein
VGLLIGLGVWLSDRWTWMVPALVGVVVGVALYRIHRVSRARRIPQLPPAELGSLLILTGFLYLYVVFLMLQLSRATGQVSVGLVAGLVVLSALLVGLAAVFLLKVKVPRRLGRLWKRLLEDR